MVLTHINNMEPLSNNASTLKIGNDQDGISNYINSKGKLTMMRIVKWRIPREKAWHTSSSHHVILIWPMMNRHKIS